MRIFSTGLAALAGLLALALPTRADSLNVAFDNGTLNTTPAIVTFLTTGSDMNGMAVTFTFTDGSTATSFWLGGSNASGDTGGVTLSLSGDSYFNQWQLANANADGLGVTKMVIDAGLGDTAFDQRFGSLTGTAGSSNGKTFSPTTGKTGLDMKATYSDIIRVAPDSPVGDLYRTLTVEFTNSGGFAAARKMSFWADTDTVEPLTTTTATQTPAPPALVLALFGLPLLFRRKRPK